MGFCENREEICRASEQSELAVCRGRQLVADRVQMPAMVGRGQANGRGRIVHYARRTSSRFCLRQNHSGATLTPRAFGYFRHRK